MKLQIDKEKYENNIKKFNQIFMGVMLPLGLVFDGYWVFSNTYTNSNRSDKTDIIINKERNRL